MSDTRGRRGEPLRIERSNPNEASGERWYYPDVTLSFLWIENIPSSCEVREI
jgi:hypothetical protein